MALVIGVGYLCWARWWWNLFRSTLPRHGGTAGIGGLLVNQDDPCAASRPARSPNCRSFPASVNAECG